MEESSSSGSFGSSCLESSKLHVCECGIVCEMDSGVYHVKICS